MSRRSESKSFQKVQNRVSILLAQIRRSIAAQDFETLLRVRRAADEWRRRCPVSRGFEAEWRRAVGHLLDRSFAELERGVLSKRTVAELMHLYRDLLMESRSDEPRPPIVITSRTPRCR